MYYRRTYYIYSINAKTLQCLRRWGDLIILRWDGFCICVHASMEGARQARYASREGELRLRRMGKLTIPARGRKPDCGLVQGGMNFRNIRV